MPLIINADDFGKSENVNKAITECFSRGYITRTTIMVNMPYAKDAAFIAQNNGFSDRVGLHINLTEGKPLTEGIAQNPDFCNEDGEFTASFYHQLSKRLHMDKKSIDDVTNEIRAQIEKYHELGFSLNHLDSHHHVHTNYPVFKALKKLSDTYFFSSIRLSRNLYKGGNRLNRVYKYFYNRQIEKICDVTTDYFGSFTDAVDYFAVSNINSKQSSSDNFRKFCSENDLEIMVHPMYSEDGVLMDTKIPFEKEILLYEVQK